MNGIFPKTRTNNFNICMQTQKTLNSQNNLEKEEWSWRNHAPWLWTILQSYSSQKSMVLTQNRYVDQWIRVQNPEINPPIHRKSIYNKRGKNIQWRKYSLFNKCCWENWTATCKRMESEHSLRLQAKIHSEWIRPQCKPGYYKTPTRKQAEHTLT